MSEEKKDLQLERELISCGFTRKDIRILFDTSEGLYPVEIMKRIRLLSNTTLLIVFLGIISVCGTIISRYYQGYEIMDSFLTAIISLSIIMIAINFVLPFKIGIKCFIFLIKKRMRII